MRSALQLILRLGVIAASGICLPSSFGADENDDWFPFSISPLADKSPAFDLRELNEKVAGESGWLRVEGEKFVDEKGREFRIFGTNLTAAAALPDLEIAGPLARHLARFGYNMVRLHFLDNQWGSSIPTLTPESNDVTRDGLRLDGLERLDRFVAELKAAGVRVNLNLHVGREYSKRPQEMPKYSKGTDLFMPDEIAALKEYSRALLTHVNPHTGVAYKDDPGISVLEISNEDSLIKLANQLGGLPDPFATELRHQWVAWLKTRYESTERLRQEWGLDTGPRGPEQVPALVRWKPEMHSGAKSSVTADEGGQAIRWEATQTGKESWSLQLSSGRTQIRADQVYQLRFRARSESGNELGISCAKAADDWNNLGLNETIKLGTNWQSFEFRIVAQDFSDTVGARLVFSLKNRLGVVEIGDLSCREVSGGYLKPDQTLEARNIPFAASGVPEKVRHDAIQFLSDTEIRFTTEIRDFLKKELGCRALITNTQVSFGGSLGTLREWEASDFVDTHGYWQHPHFPGKPWDSGDWRIGNTSQVASVEGGTLAGMAILRPIGKPYTVSEYDIPAPSDFAAEMWPMFAAYACFQNWAGLYHYTYGHRSDDFRADQLTGYFNEATHPAKDGFRPSAAVLFRLGLVSLAQKRMILQAPADELVSFAARVSTAGDKLWREAGQVERGDLDRSGGALSLRNGVALEIRKGHQEGRTGFSLSEALPSLPVDSVIRSDTSEWSWDRKGETWILRAPAARAWSGRIGGRTWEAGDVSLDVKLLSGPAPHATVMLVVLDGKPVAKSQKLLLTAMRRAENQGMGWNEERNSVGKNWGNGPVRVLGLEAKLHLPEGTKWTITPLDAAGQRRDASKKEVDSVAIHPAEKTIWWLLEK